MGGKDGLILLLQRDGSEPWDAEQANLLIDRAIARRDGVGYANGQDARLLQFEAEDRIDAAWNAMDLAGLRKAVDGFMKMFLLEGEGDATWPENDSTN